MVGENTRRTFHLLVGAILTVGTSVVGSFLTSSATGGQSWWSRLAWLGAGIIVTFFYLRWQLRSQEESPEAIKGRIVQLKSGLREEVQRRSYGARSELIEAPLSVELDLNITPRVGWVRDPLAKSKPIFEEVPDGIVAAFESSRRRLLIVGEPGSGKTMAAYSLIEYLDESEGTKGRIPLLVNLSAWEAQDTFEAFLVDYLCSSVGYEVRERVVASAFVSSRRYTLILDGLDEIPAGLRAHFSERLDKFIQGLPSKVAVVVTCRSEEYEELLKGYPKGLGLVQAVEILPLSSEQLDRAFDELVKLDEDWEEFLSQRHHKEHQRVRDLLSNPLFLNLAVVGRLRPHELLDWTTTEHELRDLVLDRFLHRTLANQSQYEPTEARLYLNWIARFLNGVEVSPFGLKTSDFTVFDLASLTPPDPPRRFRLLEALFFGLALGLAFGLAFAAAFASPWGSYSGGLVEMMRIEGLAFGLTAALVAGLVWGAVWSLVTGLVWGVLFAGMEWVLFAGMEFGLLGSDWNTILMGLLTGVLWGLLGALAGLLTSGMRHGRSAVSFHLTLSWPPNEARERLFAFLQTLVLGLVGGLTLAVILELELELPLSYYIYWLGCGLIVGLLGGFARLLKPRSVQIISRAPREAISSSLISALIFGLLWGLPYAVFFYSFLGLGAGLTAGLVGGLAAGLERGGWFVLLQKVAHRQLARDGNLPPHPTDFLEWGIERQIFREVGGGVRFRHNLIQQHLANTSEGGA